MLPRVLPHTHRPGERQERQGPEKLAQNPLALGEQGRSKDPKQEKVIDNLCIPPVRGTSAEYLTAKINRQ